jgi:8-oxo-dGTP pyrophosphatase MutT (NUDIX family)
MILTDQNALRAQIEHALGSHAVREVAPGPGLRRAAVLLPLVAASGGAALILTKRTDLVEHHKGQISFPGGALEEGERPLDAVLRETYEEIGIPPADIIMLGRLDDEVMPVSGFLVTPFVGLVPHPYRLRVNPHEVQAVLQVPLRVLLNPQNVRTEQWEQTGRDAIVYFYTAGDQVIWGFTARIIARFLAVAFGAPLRTMEAG